MNPTQTIALARRRRRPLIGALGAAVIVLAACGTTPPRADRPLLEDRVAAAAAATASEQIGRPYRYGGTTPAGFDCSGLVHYSYRRAGYGTPRTTQALWQGSAPVSRSALRPGDLLFFDQEGKKSSHVGIWLGDGRFVHAPSTGGRVRADRFDSDYWQRHFAGARRL